MEITKDIAIAFAKYICKSTITKDSSGLVGLDGKKLEEKYWPIEFQVILGELEKNGDTIYKEFIDNYNDTERVISSI